MNALQKKLGAAALLVGTIISTANLPSMAYDGCSWWYHPRRAEVMQRDAGLGNQISYDRGYLNGNYGRLMSEDASIRRQEQRDARFNGGFITSGEQGHFNREENRLQRQVNFDRRF